jgi:hypothetical protein
MKVPFCALAPTQSEPPFLVAQLAVMTIFVVLAALQCGSFIRLLGMTRPTVVIRGQFEAKVIII